MPQRQTVYYHIVCDQKHCASEVIATAEDADLAEDKADTLWFEVGGVYEHPRYLCWDCAPDDDEDEQ